MNKLREWLSWRVSAPRSATRSALASMAASLHLSSTARSIPRFDVEAPDKAWVADITYIRTHEGFAYLAVVLDLFSRRVVGWAMQERQATHALLATVWRRKPKCRVLVHSDQGTQFTSMEWVSLLKHHNLEPSMRRRSNCHDNAVAESFFNLLKRERIRRKIYRTRAEARQDVFGYIEMFYHPTRKHAWNRMP